MMQKYIYILGWTNLDVVSSMIMCTLQSLTPLIEDQSIVKAMFVLNENSEMHPY